LTAPATKFTGTPHSTKRCRSQLGGPSSGCRQVDYMNPPFLPTGKLHVLLLFYTCSLFCMTRAPRRANPYARASSSWRLPQWRRRGWQPCCWLHFFLRCVTVIGPPRAASLASFRSVRLHTAPPPPPRFSSVALVRVFLRILFGGLGSRGGSTYNWPP
jgi:hypothetical protein